MILLSVSRRYWLAVPLLVCWTIARATLGASCTSLTSCEVCVAQSSPECGFCSAPLGGGCKPAAFQPNCSADSGVWIDKTDPSGCSPPLPPHVQKCSDDKLNSDKTECLSAVLESGKRCWWCELGASTPLHCTSSKIAGKTCYDPFSDSVVCAHYVGSCTSCEADSRCQLCVKDHIFQCLARSAQCPEPYSDCAALSSTGPLVPPSTGMDSIDMFPRAQEDYTRGSIVVASVVTSVLLLLLLAFMGVVSYVVKAASRAPLYTIPVPLRHLALLPVATPADAEVRARQVSALLLAVLACLVAFVFVLACLLAPWMKSDLVLVFKDSQDSSAYTVSTTSRSFSLWRQRCDGTGPRGTCDPFFKDDDLIQKDWWSCSFSFPPRTVSDEKDMYSSTCRTLNTTRVLALFAAVLTAAALLCNIKCLIDVAWIRAVASSKRFLRGAYYLHALSLLSMVTSAGAYAAVLHPSAFEKGDLSFGGGYYMAWGCVIAHFLAFACVYTTLALVLAWTLSPKGAVHAVQLQPVKSPSAGDNKGFGFGSGSMPSAFSFSADEAKSQPEFDDDGVPTGGDEEKRSKKDKKKKKERKKKKKADEADESPAVPDAPPI